MPDIATIIADPAFRAAETHLRATHDRFVAEIVELTEIPAPPFEEAERAEAYLAMFRAAGLEEAGLDAVGNVTGIRRGRGRGGLVAVAAHLDTVFAAGTDVRVRRAGTRLFAPGIGDDTRGLAALLAFIRALDAAGIETEHDLLFVGDVGEEGKGDLRGIRHLFTEGPYRDRIAAFFSMDGIETGSLVTGAVGSHRYRVALRGPGGHTLLDFGGVNPAYALGSLLTGLAALEVPATPRTTYAAAVLGGGTSINAIPEEVWVEIDLRSEAPEELERLDAAMHRLVADAVAAENARGDTAAGTIAAEIVQIGNRPAGATPEGSAIVEDCLAAIRAFGFEPDPHASSTDANIPMSLGIPAVTFGHGGAGGRAHTLDEWIDVEPELSARGLAAALAAILATAGLAAPHA